MEDGKWIGKLDDLFYEVADVVRPAESAFLLMSLAKTA